MDYPEDFQAFWTAYKPPKNASKIMAYRAWQKTAKIRPAQDVMLGCVEAYNSWLEAESKRRKEQYPKLHAATFLSPSQRRWESFEEEGEAITASRKAQEPISRGGAWDTRLDAIEAEIGREAFCHWFLAATISQTDGVTHIDCPSLFHAQELGKRFGKVIRKAFGENVRLIVATKKSPT